MATKLLVSAACLSASQLLRSQSLSNCGFVPVSSQIGITLWPQCLKGILIGAQDSRNSSFKNARWMATAGANAESSEAVPKSVTVQVAYELLQAGHRYLDVRTPEEFAAGRASGAINVPYLFRAGSGMTKNPKFLEEVASYFSKDDKIIVGCQLGKRSLMASKDLLSAGFTGVTDIAGGYAAWTQNGLPAES